MIFSREKISVNQETLGVLNTARDNYTSYKLLAFYLAYLDQALTPSAK